MSILYWCFNFYYRLDQMRINSLFSLSESFISPETNLFNLFGNPEPELQWGEYIIRDDSTHANRIYRIWVIFGDNIELYN